MLGADSSSTRYELGPMASGKSGLAIDARGDVIVLSASYGGHRLTKFSSAVGAIVWEKMSPGGGNVTDFLTDNDDHVYVSSMRFQAGLNYAVLSKLSSLSGDLIWEFTLAENGSSKFDPSKIKKDPAGNLFFGVTRTNKLTPFGYNAGLLKISDNDGTKLWDAYLDTRMSGSNLIDVDPDGNAFLTTSYFSGDNTNWETLKFSSLTGQILWRKSFNGSLNLNDFPRAIKVDTNGDVVVTGSANAQLSGSYLSTTDIQTTKYAGLDGSVIWSRIAASPGYSDDYSNDLAIDRDGDVHMIGQYGTPSSAIWKVIKYASGTGQTLWEQSYAGMGTRDGRANVGTFDSQQRLVVLGSYGAIGASPTGMKAMKYERNGQIVWELDIPGISYAQHVAARDGTIYFGSTLSDPKIAHGTLVLIGKIVGDNPRPSLNMVLNGIGSVVVQSRPQGLICNTNCVVSFDPGTVVTLQALSNNGATFLSWAGGGCSRSPTCQITVNSSQLITATFRSNTLPPLSKRGGIDLGGNSKHALLLKDNTGNFLAGQLLGNEISFTQQTSIGGNIGAVVVADFDGNGISDLAFRVDSAEPATVYVQPDFSPSLYTKLGYVKTPWRIDAVGDLDGDGYADIVWRYTGNSGNIDDTGVSYVWFTQMTDLAKSPVIIQVRKRGGAPLSWKLLGAVDLNADESADMVYISPNNDVRVLMATPNRTCANLSGGKVPTGFKAHRLADFTGNRTGDILARNSQTGEVMLISLDALGIELPPYTGAPDDQNASCTSSSLVLKQRVFVLPSTDPSWTYFEAGDLNGDGITDIAWSRPDGSLVIWLMGRDGVIQQALLNAGTVPAGYSPVLH